MCRDRDKADVSLLSRLLFQVLPDDSQPSEFTLGPGVGLERNGMETGDIGQVLL